MVSVGKSPMAKKGMLFAGRVMAACGIDCLEDPDMLRRQLANVPGDVLAEQLFEQEAAA